MTHGTTSMILFLCYCKYACRVRVFVHFRAAAYLAGYLPPGLMEAHLFVSRVFCAGCIAALGDGFVETKEPRVSCYICPSVYQK